MTLSSPTEAVFDRLFSHFPEQRQKDEAWLRQLLSLQARDIEQRVAATEHPAFFLQHVECVDSRSGEIFEFQLLNQEESDRIGVPCRIAAKDPDYTWYWQREYLDWILDNRQTITLKGRQLGVTWVWAGLALWTSLYKRGSDVLIYSIKEDDAAEVIGRIWDMWLSLPSHLTKDIEVLKPTRGVRPSTRIEFRFPDGRVSTIDGMVATRSSGHGRSAALVIFDEASRQEYARDLWKAVIPASGDKGGMIGVVSTANGMSDGKGAGNFFHELWRGAGRANYPNLQKTFLGWFKHPDRDEEWYEKVPLDESSKAEQYPNTPEEAFLLSGSPFFSTSSLRHYASHKAEMLFRAEWLVNPTKPNTATLSKGQGFIEVYQPPEKNRKYGIGVDVATGLGTDFSVASVVDLSTGMPCAELYMKGSYEEFSAQLHFLGLWFNTARIAVEIGGGYGDTVIAYLRDGHKGRKPYPKLYRHRGYDRGDRPQSVRFGFPMNNKTRPKVISEIREWINQKLFPAMPEGLHGECLTFVHRESGTTPRAADGCNDDRVLSWGIALELFSEFGEHEHDRKKINRQAMKSAKPKTLYPWKYH